MQNIAEAPEGSRRRLCRVFLGKILNRRVSGLGQCDHLMAGEFIHLKFDDAI
jgi:hypothetical protein